MNYLYSTQDSFITSPPYPFSYTIPPARLLYYITPFILSPPQDSFITSPPYPPSYTITPPLLLYHYGTISIPCMVWLSLLYGIAIGMVGVWVRLTCNLDPFLKVLRFVWFFLAPLGSVFELEILDPEAKGPFPDLSGAPAGY